MTPVDQTKFGFPEGNCFAACVASLTGVPLEDVPPFCSREGWWEAFCEWLEQRGWYPIAGEGAPHEMIVGYVIVSGPANRGLDHATIWRHGALVHDPHPSRDGLLSAPIDPEPMFLRHPADAVLTHHQRATP